MTGMMSIFGKHRNLLWELVRRDVLGRYRGASFGVFWSLLSPFLMLTVYTVAFGYVLKARWPGASDNIGDFAMLLFIGLIVHGFFAECLTRSPSLIVSSPNLVKRIVFPLELMPVVVTISALFHACMNILVFLLINFVLRQQLPMGALLLPAVFLPLAIGVLGMSWLLSSLGVYLRDISQVAGVIATAMLFLSSAIVPVETLPEHFQIIFKLNPLTFIIDQARELLFWGRMPDWFGLSVYALGAALFTAFGYAVFQKTRRGFADVL